MFVMMVMMMVVMALMFFLTQMNAVAFGQTFVGLFTSFCIFMVMMFFLFLMIMFMMVIMFIMVIVIIVFQFAQVFGEAVRCALHDIKHILSIQIIPWGGDDAGIRIEFMDDIAVCGNDSLRAHLGAGKDDGIGRDDLIIEELLEVLMIDLTALGIHNRAVAVDRKTFYALDDPEDIGQLADTGRFNDDSVRMVLVQYLVERGLEITLQRAADTAAIDFIDDNAGFIEKSAVNTDFTELIFYKDNLLSLEYIFNQFLNQRCFASAEKT